MIEVITGLIIQENRILLTQRNKNVEFALCWESPGGKKEPGETDQETLQRELKEELNVRGKVIGDPIFMIGYDEPIVKQKCIIRTYEFVLDPGAEPKPIVAVGIGWFRLLELQRLNTCPSIDDNIRAIENHFQYLKSLG